MKSQTEQKKTIPVRQMTGCALMAALMCALCPLSIPLGPIPVSPAVFIMLLSVYLLGTWRSIVSFTVYLLLGAVGMPVFSGFQGGVAKLTGPTGGYILGFLLMIFISGLIMEGNRRNFWGTLFGMVLGVAADYCVGTIWFVFLTESTVRHALEICVIPFIPIDLLKILAVLILGKTLRRALRRAGIA